MSASESLSLRGLAWQPLLIGCGWNYWGKILKGWLLRCFFFAYFKEKWLYVAKLLCYIWEHVNNCEKEAELGGTEWREGGQQSEIKDEHVWVMTTTCWPQRLQVLNIFFPDVWKLLLTGQCSSVCVCVCTVLDNGSFLLCCIVGGITQQQ